MNSVQSEMKSIKKKKQEKRRKKKRKKREKQVCALVLKPFLENLLRFVSLSVSTLCTKEKHKQFTKMEKLQKDTKLYI